MNSSILVGNLTADPKLHVSEGGKKRATFSLAINEGQGENERTHFVNLTAFDSLAENIVDSCSKGMRLVVGARLNTYKQAAVINGEERQLTMVAYVATHVGPDLRFAVAKVTKVARDHGGSEGNANGAQGPAPAATPAPAAAPAGEASSNGSAPAEAAPAPAAVAATQGGGDDDDF